MMTKDRFFCAALSQSECDRYACLISVGLHMLFFLLGAIFMMSSIKKAPVSEYRIPVQLTVMKEAPTPPPKAKPLADSNTLVSKHALPTAKKVAPKPTRLPGDRRIPIVSKFVAPVYPKTALNNNWEGTVKLKVFILASGQIQSISIHRSSGHAILDQAFIRTVETYYKFKPKREMAEDKPGSKIVQYTFKLES